MKTEPKGSPTSEDARASSHFSVDLPAVKQEPIDSDDERANCSNYELQLRLREAEERAKQMEREKTTAEENLMEWMDKAMTAETQIHKAASELIEERKKVKEMKELEATRMEQSMKVMQKYQVELKNSMANLKKATDSMKENERLKEELGSIKGELTTVKQYNLKTEELLKIEQAKKKPLDEFAAVNWKLKELERVHEVNKNELQEALRNIGLLKNEKNNLEIDLSIAKAAVETAKQSKSEGNSGEASTEAEQKIRDLENDVERLRNLLVQVSKERSQPDVPPPAPNEEMQKLISKNVENLRTIDRLEEENADLNDRLEKLAQRLDRVNQAPPFPPLGRGGFRGRGFHGPPHNHGFKPSTWVQATAMPAEQQQKWTPVNPGEASQHKSFIEELKEKCSRLQEAVDECERSHGSWNHGHGVDREKDELRAELREKSEEVFRLQTDVDGLRTRAFTLEITNKEYREKCEKAAKDIKDISRIAEMNEQLSARIDKMKEEKKEQIEDFEKAKRELKEEIEELEEKNAALVNTRSGALREQLDAALKRIKELESDLSRPICSSGIAGRDDASSPEDGRGRKVVVETIPAPPFVLQAAARVIPPPPDKAAWKRAGFQPVGAPPAKITVATPRVVEHTIFDKPYIEPKVRDKMKFMPR